ncbi:type I restriction endonuclease subunit R [Streptosporangium sp. NPDC000396]|uniref:type I restriction endonuclease subunit R n=1 Tax=Streptosporangium sp. NPDC000396 TaxID=3366185 RepID=UPI00367DAABB
MGKPGWAPMEEDWEAYALEWLAEWGWEPLRGTQIAPETGQRPSWDELVIVPRLRDAIERINPDLPQKAVDDAVNQVLRRETQRAFSANKAVHEKLTRGVTVSYRDERGQEQNRTAWLLDFENVNTNEFIAVNQVTLKHDRRERRFDIVCYVNGLPLAIFELKRADDPYGTTETAYNQLQTYVREFGPVGFTVPAIVVASDGISARYGTPFTPWEHMAPWNVDDQGEPVRIAHGTALEVLISGLFDPPRFIDILASFISFSRKNHGIKRLAKAHQFHAVNTAVAKTLVAAARDGRAGVVWHTQGSGKSLEMEFYAAKILQQPALGNPTIVVLTDRTDLDNQLFEEFAASELLGEAPIQVSSREALREQLRTRPTGGIVFSTLQKFSLTKDEREAKIKDHPLLSDRRNVVVIVDEAHRSHYELVGENGLARNLRQALPHATFIAFTGTPIATADANTYAVFGDVIDVYDLTRAVEDGATVKVFYENRHIPVRWRTEVDPADLDERVDDLTADLDDDERLRARHAFSIYEEMIQADGRLAKVAADIVTHWKDRSAAMRKTTEFAGKGMIVGFSRRVCAALYEEIIKLEGSWHHDDDNEGKIKVVYTSHPSDKWPVSRHGRNPGQLKEIQRRMVDEKDGLELVIVRDMWLTGFDSPPLHTLYVDKPMRGAALMQAIARVNRRFKEKDAGLVVDFLGIAESLTEALAEYTPEDRERRTVGDPTSTAVDLVIERHGVICGILSGYDWRAVRDSGAPRAHVNAALGTTDYLRDPVREAQDLEARRETLPKRFTQAYRTMSQALTLCPTHERVAPLMADIRFFDSVRVYMAKFDEDARRSRGLATPQEIKIALRELAAQALDFGDVVDIYEAAGIEKPDLTKLDEVFVERFRQSMRPNLAIEALRRRIEEENRAANRLNLVRRNEMTSKIEEMFSARITAAMKRYENQALSSAEIITRLIDLARELAADRGRADAMGLDEAELAFYDAVAANESAKEILGDAKLVVIARELVKAIRGDAVVDWEERAQVQARLRSKVKRLLAKHGYPPDDEPEAVRLVLQQTKALAQEWATTAAN